MARPQDTACPQMRLMPEIAASMDAAAAMQSGGSMAQADAAMPPRPGHRCGPVSECSASTPLAALESHCQGRVAAICDGKPMEDA